MTPRINLDEVDVDGALRETADAISGDTRLTFLKKAGIAGGTLMSGGAILSALAPSAGAENQRPPEKTFGKKDVGILNFALTLEYLEAAFYNGAKSANLSLSAQGTAFLNVVTRDENAHVAFLKEVLGSRAAAEPKFDFKGTNQDPTMFLKTSQVLENTGVHAYLGQITKIAHDKYLAAAASIATIEGRHAGAVGLILETGTTGEEIAPSGPFDTPLSAKAVLKAVEETGFIVS